MSGASRFRPGYQQLLADLDCSLFDVVVVEALDRLGRKLADIADLHDRCTFAGIILIAVNVSEIDTDIRSAAELVRNAQARVSSKLRKGGKPAQNWKAWFVFRIAAFWHIVMGKQPSSSPDGAFAQLVCAAWNSLHPKIQEIKWDTYVRRFATSATLREALETASIATAYARRILQP
jgi:hypothetical protein